MVVQQGKSMLASDILDLTFFPAGSILMMDGSWMDGRGGWYICDGRVTPYGKTPDLRDKFICGGGASAGGTGGGSVTLSTDNLPGHSHSLSELTITGGEHSHGNGTLTVASGSATHSHGNGTLAVTISGGAHGHTITDPGHTHSYTSVASYHRSGPDASHVAKDDRTVATTGNSLTGITIASDTGSHAHTASVSGVIASDSTAHEHSISGSIASAGHSHTVSGGTIGSTGSGTSFAVVPAYYSMIYIKKMV
ncbi:MAG: hypothetical protein LBD62_03740 [Candidatus Margulisbacteria bacterium]|jgi:hypothetical protein|nr:hypothetical protein [Candidatus Margulisiibacteriota bacterium]